jgi:hypothetical protein
MTFSRQRWSDDSLAVFLFGLSIFRLRVCLKTIGLCGKIINSYILKWGIMMSSSTLKILACLFMLIDHLGYVLFPRLIILRIIGRLAFPLFTYFIAEGYRRTKDVTDYLGRLFLFAFISQIPFSEAFNLKGLHLNVFFTLAMGLYALYIYDKKKNILIVIVIALACQFMNTDYGAYGVFLVFLFNKYHEDFIKMAISISVITLIFSFTLTSQIQIFCLFSLILIRLYNRERGLRLKYLFYGFYPVHLLILAYIDKIKL